jgi:adenylate kinase
VILLLVAAPGAGKGTQAQNVAAHYGIAHISSGELLRRAADAGTPTGRVVAAQLERGDLVPDDVVIEVLSASLLEAARNGGVVLDGFPRSLSQATALDRLIAALPDQQLDAVVNLVVGVDELLERLLARARREGRADDTEATIAHRLEVYAAETAPLLHLYADRGLLIEVDGEQPVDRVFSDIVAAVDLQLARHSAAREGGAPD